ncbi:NAD(P)-binding protein [Westerdykella ornata]|uniref:NAD(P)-binding protein n=1 Tax=Westerdykella ornata TaxID=318751 RepID=A0A6A6J8E2_WESOR|nr:NAD(P)-binding protein [Westerdykella ornata]KAF2271479.1 NAD(P)-binding protein [Westerdykella ornata]
MAPIPFAIIGTNWITHSFVSHAHATGKWVLRAVYSRKEDTAKEFASKYNDGANISLHTSIEALANDSNITAVYIASPNILHYEHARAMLQAGKHVVVEKPATTTSAQLAELFELAHSKGLFLFEAFRHVHESNFRVLKKEVDAGRVGRLLGAELRYCQFSSRYDAVLKGEKPNVFNLDFGGGALMDLGVYCVSAAVRLFGEPKESTYFPVMVPQTGADGGGTLVLRYADGFNVTLVFSKMWHSGAPTEVWGEKGTLEIPTITDIEGVRFWDPRAKKGEEMGVKKEDLNLKEEAEVFADIFMAGDREAMKEWEKLSMAVARVTEKVRKDCGLLIQGS